MQYESRYIKPKETIEELKFDIGVLKRKIDLLEDLVRAMNFGRVQYSESSNYSEVYAVDRQWYFRCDDGIMVIQYGPFITKQHAEEQRGWCLA